MNGDSARFRICRWTFHGVQEQWDRLSFGTADVEQRLSSNPAVFHISVCLCKESSNVQQGFPEVGINMLAAAQSYISSDIYKSSWSFTVSGRKLTKGWFCSVNITERCGKCWCPPLTGQTVKKEGTGKEQILPWTLLWLWVWLWGMESCCTSKHPLNSSAVTGFQQQIS